MTKKKAPHRSERISLNLPPAFAERVRQRCAAMADSEEHGHRTWTPADLCREGLALIMAETEGAG